MRYSAYKRRLDALESALGDTVIFHWKDRNGPQKGGWLRFMRAIAYPKEEFERTRGAKLPREMCPISEFDMDQLNKLSRAQHLMIPVLLESIGFPALELVERPGGQQVWEVRRGLVRTEEHL